MYLGKSCSSGPHNGEGCLRYKSNWGCVQQMIEKMRKTRALNPELSRKSSQTYYRKHKKERLAYRARYQFVEMEEAQRALVYFYGPLVCVDCGELDRMVLTWGHTNNDGASHRREITGNQRGVSMDKLAKDLQKKGWPKGYLKAQCGSCQLREVRMARLK